MMSTMLEICKRFFVCLGMSRYLFHSLYSIIFITAGMVFEPLTFFTEPPFRIILDLFETNNIIFTEN